MVGFDVLFVNHVVKSRGLSEILVRRRFAVVQGLYKEYEMKATVTTVTWGRVL